MLKSRAREKVQIFKGQKSGYPQETYGIDSGEEITNFRLLRGKLEKTSGANTYADVLPLQSGGILSLHRLKNMNVVQRGLAVACETSEGSLVFTDVSSSVSIPVSQNKFHSAPWRDRLFFVNKVDSLFILNRDSSLSGQQFGRTGVDPPEHPTYGTAGGVSLSSGVGVMADKTYGYVLTFLDANTNSESPGWGSLINDFGQFELSMNGDFIFKPAIVSITPGASSKVTWDKVTLIAYLTANKALYPRITHFTIYRAEQLASGLWDSAFRVPLVNGGTQNGIYVINIDKFILDNQDFVDNTLTASLPAVGLPENNSPPPTLARYQKTNNILVGKTLVSSTTFTESKYTGFRYQKFFRDQLFGIGAKSGGYLASGRYGPGIPEDWIDGTRSFSDILHGSEVFQPDYYPYLWEVGRGDGQETTGLGVIGDTALLVFKERSTYYLAGASPDNFILRILDTNRGCLSEWTIQETPIGVITLDRAGFSLFAGIKDSLHISGGIQNIIETIDFTYAQKFHSAYDPKFKRYYCSVVTSGFTTPNITLILDLDSMEWTTETNMDGSCRVISAGSTGNFVHLLGMNGTGRILNLSSPSIVKFQESPIVAIWKSGAFNFGDDEHKKKIRWLYLRAEGNEDWQIDIEIIPDYDESRKHVINDFSVLNSLSLWYSSDLAADGTLIWDTGVWATDGTLREVVKIPITCVGYTFQIRIINKDQESTRHGFSIAGISCEAVMLGR